MRMISSMGACLALTLAAFPVGAATYDLTGSWGFVSSNEQGSGPCPAPQRQSGTATITQNGDGFSLVLSGIICDPAPVCTFTGTVIGSTYSGGNSVVVDKDGGTAVATIVFDAKSSSEAAGSYEATYTLADFSCQWGYDFQFARRDSAVDLGGFRMDSNAPQDGGGVSDAGVDDDGGGCGCAVAGAQRWGAMYWLLLALWITMRRRRSVS